MANKTFILKLIKLFVNADSRIQINKGTFCVREAIRDEASRNIFYNTNLRFHNLKFIYPLVLR